MAEKQDVEAGFRSALEDVIPIVQKLAPVCRTVDELLGVIETALSNDAQLRILMQIVAKDVKKKEALF